MVQTTNENLLAAEIAKTKNVPEMTPRHAALVGLMRRYLAAVMDPFVSLLEIHKLMYFMQEAGEPLKLQFAKAHYGPNAENLRHVLSLIEGHFICGYGDAEDDPEKQIELLPTLSQARKAAEVYERPLAFFYLPEPPFDLPPAPQTALATRRGPAR